MASGPEVLGESARRSRRGAALVWLLAAMLLAGVAASVVLFALTRPGRTAIEGIVAGGRQGGADAGPSTRSGATVTAVAALLASAPASARVQPLFEGPSEDYEVIGTLARNAPLEVVGRSADNAWLAVSVAPGAALYAWVPARYVLNRPDLSSLPERPALLIPPR